MRFLLLFTFCLSSLHLPLMAQEAHWDGRTGDGDPLNPRNWDTRPDQPELRPPPSSFLSVDDGMAMDLHLAETSVLFPGHLLPNGHTLTLGFGGTLLLPENGYGMVVGVSSALVIDGGHLVGRFVANCRIDIRGGGSLILDGANQPLNQSELHIFPGASARILLTRKNRDWILKHELPKMTRNNAPLREGRDFTFVATREGAGIEFIPLPETTP